MNFAKSLGEPASATPPSSTNRAFMWGSDKAALISLLSLTTISGDVPLGAPIPVHDVSSKPGRKSATVGMFGKASRRVVEVTASGLSLSALTYAMDDDNVANMTCV